MLNVLWAGMMLAGIVYGAVCGRLDKVTEAAINSSQEAVTLAITMFGIISMWSGIMEIAYKAGLIGSITKRMKKLLHFLFPGIEDGHPAKEFIATNMVANVLGLGWAATPAGLKAMQALQELNINQGGNKNMASSHMCTFLVINISSLQLIPVNIIAYRSKYGSADPMAVVAPGLIATMITTIVGIIFCKIMQRKDFLRKQI